jgi:hypothetical protein
MRSFFRSSPAQDRRLFVVKKVVLKKNFSIPPSIEAADPTDVPIPQRDRAKPARRHSNHRIGAHAGANRIVPYGTKAIRPSKGPRIKLWLWGFDPLTALRPEALNGLQFLQMARCAENNVG